MQRLDGGRISKISRKSSLGLDMQLSGYNTHLASTKPWVPFAAPHKPGVGHKPAIPVFKRWMQENQKFRVMLDYIECLRPAWAT